MTSAKLAILLLGFMVLPLAAAEEKPAGPTGLTDAEKAEIAADERKHKAKWKMEDAPAGKVYGEPGNGITLVSADGKLSANVRARIQLRYSEHWVNDYNSREIQPRTVRLFWTGHLLTTDLRYVIQLALGPKDVESASNNPDGSSPLFDAYLEWNRWRDLKITVGQFFVPFATLRTVREFALHFIDRQVPIRPLTLDRDVGIKFGSEDLFGLNQWLGYEFGLFGGRGRNRIPTTFSSTSGTTAGQQAAPGGLVIARLFLTPFGSFDHNVEGDITRSDKLRLLFSGAAAANYNSDRLYSTNNALTVRTVGTNTAVPAYTDYYNYVLDFMLKWRGVSVELEYLVKKAKDDIIGYTNTAQTTPVYSQSGHGWIIQTGAQPFPKDWPQIEFVGRFAQLYSDSPNTQLIQTADQQRNEAVGGVNYYINGHLFKVQADYFQIWGNAYTEHGIRSQLDVMF